jgi:class 3 adenylate cyclase
MSQPPYVPGPGDLASPFGPYEILRKLGRGGMATVYLVRNTRIDRREALKVPRLLDDDRIRARFLEEAKALALVRHRNICAPYETGTVRGVPYLTMLFVEGRPLGGAVAEFTAAPRRAVALAEKLARALAAAHECGVVHRDLKPDNVLLDAAGEPVIIDFGLALRLDGHTRLTRHGDVMGTPAYMAPEQLAGFIEEVGAAADVYALGVILYELVTGRRPFPAAGAELVRLKGQALFEPPCRMRPGLDPRLDDLCRRAMAADPGDRPGGMNEFAAALAALLDPGAAGPAPPGPQAAGPGASLHPGDPQIDEEVLRLLQTWGWEEALQRLDEQIRLTEDERRRALLRLTAGILHGQLGRHDEALGHYREAGALPELVAWAGVGEAFIAYRQADFARAAAILERAEAGNPGDRFLTAAIAHLRGTILYKQHHGTEAVPHLYRAAELYGPDHYGFGWVLDTLGMFYATRGDFALGRAFYQRALEVKQRHDDRLGLALTYGQLGRLLLDWGDLDGARACFEADLGVCWSISDLFGEAKIHNHLGQVELARGRPQRALEHLNESVTRTEAGRWAVAEAFARKDRARALLALGRADEAEADARQAEELFRQRDFAEGTFHARRVLAQVQAGRGQLDQAEKLLRQAANFFAQREMPQESARTWLELARLRRRAAAAPALVGQVLRQALDQAEQSRREQLIADVERDLADVDPAELLRRNYERARGRGIAEEVGSLTDFRQETASMLFLDLRDFTDFAREEEALLVRRRLNQIWADLEPVLQRHGLVVNQYLGDGFMALARGDGYARRAVAAGLDMLSAIDEHSRPRRLLGLREVAVRIGVSTGGVVFANVGTYRKIDFTAVGAATNEAARLQAVAEAGAVCVGAATWKEVQAVFRARHGDGRQVPLKGFGMATVWDVVGRPEAGGR